MLNGRDAPHRPIKAGEAWEREAALKGSRYRNGGAGAGPAAARAAS